MAEIAGEHGVHGNQITRWKKFILTRGSTLHVAPINLGTGYPTDSSAEYTVFFVFMPILG
ncbi:MAG: hypothetical protein HQK57_08660 [Deltaproteobacteria bacterium]|nr:hypothetical protein [Deltaproteobacteria bacterium]